MSEQPANAPTPARLNELAQLLRESHHLGPEAQAELADLVEELHRAMQPGNLTNESKAHIEETAAHLVHALHHRQDASLLQAARQRLEEAAVRVEAEAPVASGVVHRLVDALANIGI